MSGTIISVENLSKSYRLGVIGTGTFYGDLKRWWARQRGKPDPYLKVGDADHGNRQGETIWALKNINFTVQQGEALGVIGRNGAGKSTLLKILSQVTSPTSGEVKLKGRVASLLEVGTGFHPELTGRENIFINGAIMGMSRAEVTRKFDEIVDFAGVEKFIDTPVKRYSSGMYVRLAFGVAAHLEPEILLVDEVLAVGDAAFQKKCLGKMGDVAKEGRTVLFVSHNIGAITELCQRAIWLGEGKITLDGEANSVAAAYLLSTHGYSLSDGTLPDTVSHYGTGEALLRRVMIRNTRGEIINQVFLGQKFQIACIFEVKERIKEAIVEVGISAPDGLRVATVHNIDEERPSLDLEPGFHEIIAEVDTTLLPHEYVIDVGLHLHSGFTVDWVERVLHFTALNVSETGGDHYRWVAVRGFVRPKSAWHHAPAANYSPASPKNE